MSVNGEQLELVVEKENLEDVITLIFTKLSRHKDQQREIDDKLFNDFNIQRGRLNELIANPEQIESLEKEETIAFLVAIHAVTNDETANPINYFSKKEINRIMKFEFETEELSFPYTIENVLRSSESDFVCVMSYKELVGWYHSKMITYNFDCQRLPVEKLMKKGKISIKPKTVLRSVKAIAERMLKGEFSTDTIILNVLVNGNDHIEYQNGSLTIYDGTEVDIIDGWHRLQAMTLVLEEQPDFVDNMNVSIKHYTLKKAQEALGQFNTVNPFDKVLSKHYSQKGHPRSIVKKLMEDSDLKNKIAIKTSVSKKLGKLTNTDVLSKFIGVLFNIDNDLEEEIVFEHLKRFFGILINSYPKEFKTEMEKTLKVSWINHHNTFVGYLVLARKLMDKYGKNFPIDEVTRIVSAIDMTKTDNEYNTIMREQGNRNSDQSKVLIQKYFERHVDALIK
jgi:hypothetical protein